MLFYPLKCQKQVTLFTVAVWINNGSEIICESHVIVTDELSHDKKTVAVMMSHIIDQIVKKHTAIKKVHVFSDGPSSQFKNKYIAHFLHQLSVQIEWHYFATSHGKEWLTGVEEQWREWYGMLCLREKCIQSKMPKHLQKLQSQHPRQ